MDDIMITIWDEYDEENTQETYIIDFVSKNLVKYSKNMDIGPGYELDDEYIGFELRHNEKSLGRYETCLSHKATQCSEHINETIPIDDKFCYKLTEIIFDYKLTAITDGYTINIESVSSKRSKKLRIDGFPHDTHFITLNEEELTPYHKKLLQSRGDMYTLYDDNGSKHFVCMFRENNKYTVGCHIENVDLDNEKEQLLLSLLEIINPKDINVEVYPGGAAMYYYVNDKFNQIYGKYCWSSSRGYYSNVHFIGSYYNDRVEDQVPWYDFNAMKNMIEFINNKSR